MSLTVEASGANAPRPNEREASQALYATAHWLHRRARYREAAAIARALVRMAPADERGWLMLGACHEGIDQPEVALEIYGVGRAVASPAPRCEIARARVLRALGRADESDGAYELAARAAARASDDDLARLIEGERRLE